MEQKNNKLPKREEIDNQYKWKLENIYSSNADWETDFRKVKQLAGEVSGFKGMLGQSSEKLLSCLVLNDELLSLNDKIFVYARMKRDEDNNIPENQALTDRAMALSTEVYAAISFIVPEIISLPEDRLDSFMESSRELQLYRQYINEILRQKKHILSEREEEILALSAEMAHSPRDIFSMFKIGRAHV